MFDERKIWDGDYYKYHVCNTHNDTAIIYVDVDDVGGRRYYDAATKRQIERDEIKKMERSILANASQCLDTAANHDVIRRKIANHDANMYTASKGFGYYSLADFTSVIYLPHSNKYKYLECVPVSTDYMISCTLRECAMHDK